MHNKIVIEIAKLSYYLPKEWLSKLTECGLTLTVLNKTPKEVVVEMKSYWCTNNHMPDQERRKMSCEVNKKQDQLKSYVKI